MNTYEKKHKEEIIRATQLWECGDITRGNLEYIFPELAESEDEKIRKALLDLFKIENFNGYVALNGIDVDDVITWLENQGEQKHVCSEEDKKIKNALIAYFEAKELGIHYDFPGYFQVEYKDVLSWLEKQGEQKSAVNFKAKDWYVSKVDGKIHNMTHNPTDSNKSKIPIEIFGRKVVLVEDDTSFCDKRCAFFTSGVCEASIQWCACEDSKGNTNRHFESVKDDNDTQDSTLPFH